MDDWNSVTKIGARVGGGGGGGPRETTIKSRSQLNAAQRAGNVIGTEKKFSTANSGGTGSAGGGGQRLTKVDREDGPVKPNFAPKDIGQQMIKARSQKEPKWTQDDLAKHSNVNVNEIKKWENGTAQFNEGQFNKLEAALGKYLRGTMAGQDKPAKKLPKWKQKELDAAKKEAEAKEKAGK